MAKYLIVNADDFGMCHSANEAVMDLFRDGKIFSSTIMMPCPAAREAVDFSIENPQYAIGVHLTMTSEWRTYRWKPLSPGKSLLDEYGYMWHESDDVGHHAKLKDLENEVRAQIDYAHALGMKPSHIDNHMGSLYGHETGRLSLLDMTLRVMGEYGYAYRLYTDAAPSVTPAGIPYPVYKASSYITRALAKKYNVIMPDFLLFPDWTDDLKTSYEHYRETILKIWTDIPDGITETFIHPAFDTEELAGITATHTYRFWEYTLMKDPETHKYLNDHGVTLISYRDLIAMKQEEKRRK
ncbi:MAG: polysaccharide deacetylase family protein [Clostridia bacterium]|nr:polysaccharide deacetylase family protein [Clostridia bacterium]